MWASDNGQYEIVRTLLEYKADVNAKDNVRNQVMMMMMMMMMIVINDEDIIDCRCYGVDDR
jgi:hypothetical protein